MSHIPSLHDELEAVKRILNRERMARLESERILEEKSAQLYAANQQLLEINRKLEAEVQRRTKEIRTIAQIPKESPEPILRLDLQGNVLYQNAVATQLEGFIYQKESYLPADFWKRLITLLPKQNSVFVLESRVVNEQTFFSWVCRIFWDEGHVNIYGRNITKLRKTKTELQRLSLIVKETQSSVVVTDAEGYISWINPSFTALTGYTLQDVYGIKPGKLLQGKDTDPKTIAYIRQQIQRQEEFECEILNYDKEKRPYWIRIQAQPLFDSDGTLIQYFAIEEDITQSKMISEAIKKREEKYRSIIENMNLGLVEVDNDEIILYANQSFCHLTGYSQQELLGKKAPSVLLRVEGSAFMEAKQRQRLQGVSDAYEIAILTKSGETRWMLISGAPLYNDVGVVIGSIGIHLDITDQKKLELELREAKQIAEESSKAKELFLANMSHEIRTPMNAVIGMSRLLAKTPLDDDQTLYLNAITTSANNLLVIINDILDISKIEAGRMHIEHIDFSLPDLVAQIQNVIGYKAEEKALSFTFEVDSQIPIWLQGDPYRINQVLLNLVGNAIKFTNKGSVHLSCQYLGLQDGLNRVEFSVTDTGIGVDEAFLGNIFSFFSQEDVSITRKFGGTGLGLSISKLLVELMGGTIKAESVKGVGTKMTFILSLPTAHTHTLKSQLENPMKAEISLAGRKILLVEDNVLNRLLAGIILKNHGAVVIEAENGIEALERFQEHKIDVILMDMQMPLMDGIETTKHIRHDYKSDIPIIALTASALKGDNIQCLDAGMNDYLSKPFEEEDLIHKINHWLQISESSSVEQSALDQPAQTLYSIENFEKTARGNQMLIRVLLKTYLEQTEKTLDEMQESLFEEMDIPRLRKLAHSLKPTLKSVSLLSLQEDIAQLEQWDSANDLETLHTLFNRLKHLVLYVNQDIRTSYLANE